MTGAYADSRRIPRRTSTRPTGRPRGVRDRRGRAFRSDNDRRRARGFQLLSAEFGARLRQLREERDIAASELGAAVGASAWTVLRMERGHIPGVPMLLALSVALGCSLVDLMPERAHHR